MVFLDFLRPFFHRKNGNTFKICVLGLDNSGKSTIMRVLSEEDITEVIPTHGFIIKSIMHQSSGIILNTWDVGGQRSLRPYWRNYYHQVKAIIYVIDSSDRRRLEETGIELEHLLEEDQLSGLPLLIYANKQDLINALSVTDLSNGLNLHKIRDRHWQILGCSAKSNEGLQDGIDFLVSQLKKSSSTSEG